MKDHKPAKIFKLRIILVVIMTAGLFFFAGRLSHVVNNGCVVDKFEYINQRIACGDDIVVDKSNYVAFKSQVSDYIEKMKLEGRVDSVSIYFRDLLYGPTFGIDEYTDFSPASLLKLPMMITYLGLSEKNPNILDVKLYFEGSNNDFVQSIKPSKWAQPNVNYSIRELIDFMIKQSDNNSYYALLEYMNQISPNTQVLRNTFIDLGIVDPRFDFDETITVKSYAGIFTQLYNSTYFSKKETSEMAIEILSDTEFASGLVAGVPKGLSVAHKFGERYGGSSKVQFHDCGIVYYPKNPYLLCIMTKGDKLDDLVEVLSNISKMVYEEFDSRRL